MGILTQSTNTTPVRLHFATLGIEDPRSVPYLQSCYSNTLFHIARWSRHLVHADKMSGMFNMLERVK